MPDPQVIPSNAVAGVVSTEILIDGNRIPEVIQVLSISIHKQVNRIPSATLVIRDGSTAAETFEVSDGDLFTPGKSIEIKGGYDGNKTTLFKGILICHSIKIRENAQSFLTIECKDEVVRLSLGRKNKYFTQTKDSDVMGELLGSLAGDIEDTNETHDELVQHHTNDWDFLCMRAEANGKLVIADDGVVNIKAPVTEAAALSIRFGATILEFEAEMDARNTWQAVKASSWNYTRQELETAETTDVDFDDLQGNFSPQALAIAAAPEFFELRHSGQLSSSETEAWAKAAMLKSRMAKIRGRAKFTGFPGLKPGNWLGLEGVGSRFQGRAFVSAIRHDFSGGSWFTHAQFGMEPTWAAARAEVGDFPSGGLHNGVTGLQIGIVVQLENDPNGDHRILVKLPTLDNDARGIWSRVACLDAGNERGSFFRPEIGDEVVVGFINGDPREAVVLGQLNSQAKPAPITASDDNHIKGLYTRSKMKLQFDDEKKIITIETPGGNSIVIDEDDQSITLKDQNNNKIKMGTDGIEMSSPKDIKINAQGKIEQKATQDMSIEGMNTNIKANTALGLNGQASASLESSGVAKIQGNLVKIN
ncbi:type VI secretion system tip protein VgrG [Haliscomenobacter sp.]|uniref:type VI secretion system tip protein VgrG n=1 Tax=Haliscomenobacter sp. TaxID=2717303 RepID=UPI003BAADF90